MRWDDTPYRKLYLDGPFSAWHLNVSLPARGLFDELLKILDHLGMLYVGRTRPADAVARALNGTPDYVDPCLAELLEEGCLVLAEYEGQRVILMRNFVDAQEARASDRVRKAESRARARDRAKQTPAQLQGRQLTLGPRDAKESQPTLGSRPAQIRRDQLHSPPPPPNGGPSSPSASETTTPAPGAPGSPEWQALMDKIHGPSDTAQAAPEPQLVTGAKP